MSSQHVKSFRQSCGYSYHRRSKHHDYYGPFIYHIILKKQKNFERFGEVRGDARIEYGNPGCAYIQESELGKIIAKAILHLPYDYPAVKIHQFCVMPDHVHILLQVLFKTPRHLDDYIDALEERIGGKVFSVSRNFN